MRYRPQRGECVITVMLGRLVFESPGSVRSGLLPLPPTGHNVNPLNEKIRAGLLHNKRRSQYFIEKLFCLGEFFFSREDANQALQISQRLLVLISLFA